MRIVIAPDKFKGSLEAGEVVTGLSRALADGGLDAEIVGVPMADGGEGTVDAALSAGYRPVRLSVHGPVGGVVEATIAVDAASATAVIEMAAASGLGTLPRNAEGQPAFDALRASSRGTGELIAGALDLGCRRIVLGVGGSANTDGGAGMLAALGARVLDAAGNAVPDGGGGLGELGSVDLGGLDSRLADVELILAADVTNPLLGPRGTAAVFAPQKGADPREVTLLEANLGRLVEALAAARGESARRVADEPGAGAAGGVGYATLLVGGVQRAGARVVMELVGLDRAVRGADVVITGEGSLDGQSLGGKTPVGVAVRARELGVPVVLAVCGRAALSAAERDSVPFDRIWALTDIEPDPASCMRNAAALLARVGREIVDYLDPGLPTDSPLAIG